jgi:hypothetical protein
MEDIGILVGKIYRARRRSSPLWLRCVLEESGRLAENAFVDVEDTLFGHFWLEIARSIAVAALFVNCDVLVSLLPSVTVVCFSRSCAPRASFWFVKPVKSPGHCCLPSFLSHASPAAFGLTGGSPSPTLIMSISLLTLYRVRIASTIICMHNLLEEIARVGNTRRQKLSTLCRSIVFGRHG